MEVLRAGPEELPAVRAIAAAYGNFAEWPRRPDYVDFELERRGLWVARDGDGVAGFAGVLVDGPIAHLADLFVHPDRLGRGIGRALLAAALPSDRTLVTFASGDPRALPLYARAGLRPLAPLLYLAGRLDAAAAGVQRVRPADLAARDAAAAGRERAPALALLERAGADGLATGDDAYAIVRPAPDGAWIGPAAGGAAELAALVAAASAEHGAVQLALPGPHPALRGLLDAGLRITDRDTYMASRPGVHDLERYVPHTDFG